MYIRRDRCAVKCLITRALSQYSDGLSALDYWYDDNMLDPRECSLPFDSTVLANWNIIFQKLGYSQFISDSFERVRSSSQKLAIQYDIPPSAFHALLAF